MSILEKLAELCEHNELREIYYALLRIERRLSSIEHRIGSRYGVRVWFYSHGYWYNDKEKLDMAINQGGQGTFAAQLLDNGSPITAPNPFTWSVDDSQATVTPSSDTLSAVVSIPAGDPATTVTITASTPAPDGTNASGTLSVPVTAQAQQFTVTITQQ